MEEQGKTQKQINDSTQNYGLALIILAFIALLIALLQ
jgi:hypothetical protein